MSGSVVWATVVGLLLGCVIGVATMGAALLPMQFKLQQEPAGSKAVRMEMEERNNAAAMEETASRTPPQANLRTAQEP